MPAADHLSGKEHPLAEPAQSGAAHAPCRRGSDCFHRVHHQPQLVPQLFPDVVRSFRGDDQVGKRAVAELVTKLSLRAQS